MKPPVYESAGFEAIPRIQGADPAYHLRELLGTTRWNRAAEIVFAYEYNIVNVFELFLKLC